MLRNREIRRLAAVLAAVTAVGAAVGFMIHPAAGLLALACAAAFSVVFFVFTRARYRRISLLSEQIDKVLHHDDRLAFSEMDEGEFSILQSEITKMTLRIAEQNDALKKEKQHFAESLADIAHQLRTPLTSVTLIVSLLENTSDPEERKKYLREAEELLVQMDWLITSLLKLSRLDAGIVVFQKERVDLSRLLQAAVRPLLIPMELHSITLRQDVPAGVTVSGDCNWLSEAIGNILKNCMESAGDGGTIEMACEDTLLFTELAIHDSGPGFEAEDLRRLFDRFYRGKSSDAPGFGIGMALCKTIITRQGGTVKAKNHPQGGAVFTIRFPK